MIPLAAVIAVSTAVGLWSEGRFGAAADRLARRLLTIALWTLMPVIAFFALSSLHITTNVGAGIAYGYVAMGVTLLAAWSIGTYVLRLPRPGVGALMICSGLANTGYLGLPFNAALFDHDEFANAVAYDALVSGILFVTVGFTIGAAFGSVASGVRDRVKVLFTRSPPLWASAAGLLAPDSLSPSWSLDVVRVLVMVILVIGCFAVGVTLAHEAADGAAPFPPPLTRSVVVAVALKALLPVSVLAVLAAVFISIPEPYYVQATMPAAINCVVISNAYGLDRVLAASAIAWGTFLTVVAGVVVSLV